MMLLATLLGLVIGPLADHYGYRRTLCICLLAVVTSSLTTGRATTLSLLVLAALVGAIGRAAIMPVAQAIVASSCVDDTARRHDVSRTQNGGPLAATLGVPLLMGIAAALQRRGAFVVLSGLALATALILWRMLCRDEAAGRGPVRLQSILAAYRPLVRHRASLTVIVAACLEQAGVWVMWTYYGAFYVQQHAFSTQQVGWVSLAAGLGVLLGQTAAGGRLGSRPEYHVTLHTPTLPKRCTGQHQTRSGNTSNGCSGLTETPVPYRLTHLPATEVMVRHCLAATSDRLKRTRRRGNV